MREDVDEAIRMARTENQFFHLLREKGYDIKFGQDITLRPAGRDRGLKLVRNFGEAYTMEAIRRRILTEEKSSFQKVSYRLVQGKRKTGQIFLYGTFQPKRKIGPEAQKLGDYSYWRSQGTFVKRQERDKPVLILEPGKEYEREDGSIGTYYNAKKLYEPSQTSLHNYTHEKGRWHREER